MVIQSLLSFDFLFTVKHFIITIKKFIRFVFLISYLEKDDKMLDFSNKFKIEENTIYKSKYWTWSLRPEQVTLGSSILSLNRKCRNFSELDKEEFADLESIVKLIEKTLKSTFSYNKINYLMLMMVDDHVHFHVLPRYEEIRDLYGLKWIDQDWPRPSRLESFINDDEILSKIVSDLKSNIAKKSDFVVGYATGVFGHVPYRTP